MRLFYRLFRLIFLIIFKIFYRLEVHGLENLPEGAAIIAANHTSFFDPPVVGVSVPEEIHYMAKESLFSWPLLKQLLPRLNSHPVKGEARDLATFKTVNNLLKEGKKVVIFPEGERSFDGELSEIQSGIAVLSYRTKSPIVPVYLHGIYNVWPRGRRFPKPFGKFICMIGKPIEMARFEGFDKKEAHDRMKQALKQKLLELKTRVLSS